MNQDDPTGQEAEAPHNRLSRLSEATLRINENLDFQSVLQNLVDSACDLTAARYGARRPSVRPSPVDLDGSGDLVLQEVCAAGIVGLAVPATNGPINLLSCLEVDDDIRFHRSCSERNFEGVAHSVPPR
ncbi:MAG: hypothetical protein F4Y14_13630 [Acidobacteria bacterium]|nr:hypothetical protein [Acidobacteriota bacterium]